MEKITDLKENSNGGIIHLGEKLKKEKLSLDTELLRPYFKLENVVDGVFQVANKLYGLTFQKDDSVDVYHEDVTAYRVHGENDEYVGLLRRLFSKKRKKRRRLDDKLQRTISKRREKTIVLISQLFVTLQNHQRQSLLF